MSARTRLRQYISTEANRPILKVDWVQRGGAVCLEQILTRDM